MRARRQEHEYETMADRPGALDRKLSELVREGRKVLGFWRSGWRGWTFKLMAER